MKAIKPQKEAVLGLLLVVLTGLTGCGKERRTDSHPDATGTPASAEDSQLSFKLATGEPGEALDYYDKVELRSGLDLVVPDGTKRKLNPTHTLADVLAFAGYAGVSFKDLDALSPVAINDPAAFPNGSPGHTIQKGDLIAVSFFAPKITDVSTLIDTVPNPQDRRKVGFRKCVRVKPVTDSSADKKGFSEIWILFNYFVPSAAVAGPVPRLQGSVNTQVILVTKVPGAGSDPIYWLVYGPTATEGVLTDFLGATFDARHPLAALDVGDPSVTSTVRKYFVPTACAVCHGVPGLAITQRDFSRAKLNYLDTDHWDQRLNADATDPGIDFGDVKAAAVRTLLDSNFADFIELNDHIKTQNTAADGTGGDTFQTRAVKTWLDQHRGGKEVSTPFERAVPRTTPGGTPVIWSATGDPDRELLPLLDRYCYRCHSSVAYNVYDKLEVWKKKSKIKFRMDLPFDPAHAPDSEENQRRMPQDRELEATVKQRIIDLVGRLPNQIPP